ncbi:phosphate ABC transporter permease PstA [Catenulispora rubra]|uniref:phosphate ABC transporter permease PstA n=1 Tax=Catenulispora rubra TaxID=280293 RepID=UPI001E541829|nr:phosphate ABC transporter permease PstA [Catenulispora rubra]
MTAIAEDVEGFENIENIENTENIEDLETQDSDETTVPPEPPESPEDGAPPERRRRVRRLKPDALFALLGAAAAAVSLTVLISDWFAPFSGPLGFVVLCYPLFLICYGILVWTDESGPILRDRLMAVVTHSIAILVFCVLVLIVGFPIWGGVKSLTHLNFYTQDLRVAGPVQPISIGGVRHAVIGTVEQITITLAITVPLGIACAVFMNESPGRLANLVRTVAAAATALPSIVAGLFVFALLILEFGLPKSGLAAALALSIMTLPIIIRASDVVLRLVPGHLKEASYALGASRWRTALRVTIPTARSGLATAVILGAARGIGETSPVLLTAGYTQYTNYDPRRGPQTSLPLATFKLVTSGQPNYITRGYGAAALLMLLVLVLFVAARAVGGKGAGQLNRRQRRRRTVSSRRVQARFLARRADHGTAGFEATGLAAIGFAPTEPAPTDPALTDPAPTGPTATSPAATDQPDPTERPS